MTKKKTDRQKAIDKFERLFTKTFGDKASFDLQHRIEVRVPLSIMVWEDIEPCVEKLMVESGVKP